jgi:hypothetical protein
VKVVHQPRQPETGIRLDVGDGTFVTCSSLPAAVGDAVIAAEPLRYGQGNAATGGIWRVRGPAGSAVLKLARPPAGSAHAPPPAWPTSEDPAHWNYWRREFLAYQTGLAAAAYAAGGIAAPALLAASSRTDGQLEVWLADVDGPSGFGWPVPRLARFAHELGVAQARWAERVPDTPWLSSGWLAQYLTEGPIRSVRLEPAYWDHPSVAVWPAAVRDQLRRLWADRDRALAATTIIERTLCHLDVWPANLVDDAGTSVLLDWSFTGDGAIGEDVANLIVDSVADGLMDAALLPEIADAATEAYLTGLRDGGWPGPPDRVRSAIAACGVAKYCWLAPAFIGRAVHDNLGPRSYGQDPSAAAAIQRLTPVVTLLAAWTAATESRW